MTHNSTVVSVPGKIHLMGEHSVVYGKPAIIAAVNKRCAVNICHYDKQALLGCQDDSFISLCLKEASSFYKKENNFFLKDVVSDIPLGSGMGSSAAVAVAIVGAVSRIATGEINKQQVNEIAFNCEKYMHGNPSGGDNTACTYGGFIWYQKKSEIEIIITPLPFSISEKISSWFFIINTGMPLESTIEMVAQIKDKRSKFKDKVDSIFNEQEKLTHQLLSALKNSNTSEISFCITEGEKNLEDLGVVSESTKNLIREIESSGGAAKICGAGGRKKASGIVLVFFNDISKIQEIAQGFNFSCERIKMGEEGVRIENKSLSSRPRPQPRGGIYLKSVIS